MFLSVSLFITVGNVFAQSDHHNNHRDLPRIAVYVTGNVGENEKSALGTRMLASLIRSGRYRGIERSNAFLAEIEREQEHQRSGAIDDSQISELGRRFGVKYVCIASITPAFGSFQVSARIVDVETAEVLFIGESHSPLQTMTDLTQVSNEVVRDMFGDFARHAPHVSPPAPERLSDTTQTSDRESERQVIATHKQEDAPQEVATAPEDKSAREPEPAPTVIIHDPEIAPQIETQTQIARPAATSSDTQNHSRLRLVMRLSTGALAAGGLIGGVVFDGMVKEELERYRDFGTPSEPRGTEAENPDRVREMRRNIDNNALMRNALYILGGIGAAGFGVTLFF